MGWLICGVINVLPTVFGYEMKHNNEKLNYFNSERLLMNAKGNTFCILVDTLNKCGRIKIDSRGDYQWTEEAM